MSSNPLGSGERLGGLRGSGLGPGASSDRSSANGSTATAHFDFADLRFEDLFRILHDFVIVLGPHAEIETMWSSNVGITADLRTALLGRPIKDVLALESYAQLRDWLHRGGTGRFGEAVEFPVDLPDGRHWFALGAMPTVHARSSLSTSCLYGRDVTEKNKRLENIRKREALLRKAEEIGKMGCWEIDLETGEGAWSDQLYRLLGQDPKGPPMDRERFVALLHPEDRERVTNIPGLSPWNGAYPEHEARFLLPDGRIRTFFTRAVPVTDEAGRVTHMVGLSEDVSERREFQDRLQRSEALLAEAERLADMGSWEFDLRLKTHTWSAQFCRMLGVHPNSEPSLCGDGHRGIHPDDMEEAVKDLAALETTGRPLDNELRFVTVSGKVRVFHSRAVAIKDESGAVICIRGTSQDITERRREEERVRLSEALLAQAERMANLGSWEFDLKTETTTLSKSLLRLYGLDCSSEFTREWYWSCLHPSDRRRARILANRGWRNGKPFVYMARFVRPNGRTRVHFVRGVPILNPEGRAIGSIGVVQDITDQRRVVQDLRRLSQEMMRTRDQERRETARALHESAGQSLAALKMTLSRIKNSAGHSAEKLQQLWKTAVELTEAAVREVRTVSYLMHPPLLDEAGLSAALHWYVTGFTERSGIDVSLEVSERVGRQSQDIETTLFRMIQEALTNVHRYSGSRKAWIRVIRAHGRITAEVRDEGRGLCVDRKTSAKAVPLGVGISGMRERVEQLGGTFELESSPGRGTTLRATLPLAAHAKDTILGSDESEGRDAKRQRRKAKPAGTQSV